MGVRNWIARKSIEIGLTKQSAGNITSSMPEAASNDYYEAQVVCDVSPSGLAVVRNVDDENVISHYYDPSFDDTRKIITPNSTLKNYNFRLRHYLMGYLITETEPLRFLIRHIVRANYLLIKREKGIQDRFNRNKLVRRDRIEILDLFLAQTVKDRGFSASSTTIREIAYGQRSFSHPQSDELRSYTNLLLKSLLQDGHLDFRADQYSLTPAGVAALDLYLIEERRHGSAIRQQHALTVLTLVLAIVGCAQVFVTYYNG